MSYRAARDDGILSLGQAEGAPHHRMVALPLLLSSTGTSSRRATRTTCSCRPFSTTLYPDTHALWWPAVRSSNTLHTVMVFAHANALEMPAWKHPMQKIELRPAPGQLATTIFLDGRSDGFSLAHLYMVGLTHEAYGIRRLGTRRYCCSHLCDNSFDIVCASGPHYPDVAFKYGHFTAADGQRRSSNEDMCNKALCGC